MTHRSNALLAACLLAACTAAARKGGDMKPLQFPADVKSSQLRDGDAEKRWREPKDLHVELDGGVRTDGDNLRLAAIVENRASEPFDLVVWPYGGSFPYGGDSPFRMAFSPAAGELVKYAGELFPPEPPLPMQITLPGKSRVRFVAEIDLARYEWRGAPEIELEWAFHYFREPHPAGKLAVKLPAR